MKLPEGFTMAFGPNFTLFAEDSYIFKQMIVKNQSLRFILLTPSTRIVQLLLIPIRNEKLLLWVNCKG
jgi:hypothetical protein